MSTAKLQKYVNLALNNSSEGEAQTAARMFFKKLRSLDMRFNSKTWGLTKDQAHKLMVLGGVQIKGAKPEPSKAEPVSTDGEVFTLSDLCKFYGMEPSKARRILRKHFGTQNKRWSWTFGPELDEVRKILLNAKK